MQPYTWAAFYQDGEFLYQFDPVTGVESSSDKIDRKLVRKVVFYGPAGPVATVQVDEGSVFFYRRRVALTGNSGDDRETRGIVHILGCWRKLNTETYPIIQHALLVPEVSYGVPIVEMIGQPSPEGDRYAVVPVQAELDAFADAPPLVQS